MTLSFANSYKEAMSFYEQNGYFVEPDVLSGSFCNMLIETAHKFPNAVDGHFRPVMQPHVNELIFMKTLNHPQVVRVMNSLLGGKVNGLQTEFFYGRPGVKGFASHQDNFFVEADSSAFASAWIALTDVGPENGGLFGFPGTHKLGKLPVRSLTVGPVDGQDPNANNEETVVPAEYRPINIIAPKGSVVFLHAYFVHGSHLNKSRDFRYATLCTYIREGARYRPGRYAKRNAIPLTCVQEY